MIFVSNIKIQTRLLNADDSHEVCTATSRLLSQQREMFGH